MSGPREPGASIDIPAVPNLRDLGGWPARDGRRVRWGLLYRSTELNQLQGEGMTAFEALGIRSVYDLRTEVERRVQPDRLPAGTQHVVLDVMKDLTGAAPAHLFELMQHPNEAEETLGGGKGLALFEAGYRQVVTLPSALAGYGRLFRDLGHAQHRPALFHCTTGKDRTGWAAAVTLLLLGVSEKDVMKEYLLTNKELLPAEQPAIERFVALGGDAEVIRPVIGVSPQYLQAALDEMREKFGTVEGYFADGLGIGSAEQERLRETFLD